MKYKTSQLLNDLYAQTESNLNNAIGTWQVLPSPVMNTSPAPGAWSATQCLEHLNSYGRYYLPAIEKAISVSMNTKPSPDFKSSWLGNYFYKSMMTGVNGMPGKKMRSPKNHRPPANLNTAAVIEEFISQQEHLGILLNRVQEVNLEQAKLPVSIAPFIKLKLGDCLLFLIAHINRHILQAERALQIAEEKWLIDNPITSSIHTNNKTTHTSSYLIHG